MLRITVPKKPDDNTCWSRLERTQLTDAWNEKNENNVELKTSNKIGSININHGNVSRESESAEKGRELTQDEH